MPVFIDVKSRLDVSAAQLAAREAVRLFTRAGEDISKGFSHSISKGMGAFDASAMRAQLQSVQAEYGRLAAAEEEAARRMVRANGMVEVSQKRLAEATAKYTADSSKAMAANVAAADAHAIAAREARAHTDSMVAAEVAAARMATATDKAASSVGRAGQLFNAAGIGSIGLLGAAMVETGKKAGDFEQGMLKLKAAAGVPVQDLKTISDGILSMAGKVGYTTSQLQQGMFTISKYGYNAADGLKILQAAAQGANAEQADLSEVVNALTLSMHNFKAGPEEAAKVMSQMVTAVGESRGSLQDFAGALHTIEPMAANLGLKLQDVWGVLAQGAKSGASFDQTADNMLNAMRALSGAQGPARDAMQQLGISADEVSQHLSERGLAGTMQYLSDTVMKHFADSNHVQVGELRQAAQASADAKAMLDGLSPSARASAEAMMNGSMSHIAYMKAVRGSTEQDAVRMHQIEQLVDKTDGFSKRMANGREVVETATQALVELTGTTAGASIALQTTGAHAEETNDGIKKIGETTADADGSVKGFRESQEGLNAKMRDSKAAFGAAAAEIGSVFVPVMVHVANAAKDVGEWMEHNKGVSEAMIYTLGGVATAWGAVKVAMALKGTFDAITSGLDLVKAKFGATTEAATISNAAMASAGTSAQTGAAGVQVAAAEEVAAEERVAASAVEADAALAGGRGAGARGLMGAAGPVSAGLLAGDLIDEAAAHQAQKHPNNPFATGVNQFLHFPGSGFGAINWARENLFAGGGAIHGAGARGHDSVPAFLAPGEHVLTHHDVSAMGGHGMVYSFRNALHRQYGGSVGPDVQVAHSMEGHAYSQGSRWDCSGSVGRVILGAMGLPANGLPTTVNMGQWLSALGFRPGTGGPGSISVGWYDHGGGNAGHAAMTLSDGENAESGGSHGSFLVGAGAAGANSAQFDHHMFLQTPYGQGPGGGMPGMGGFGGGGFGGGGGGGGGIPAGGVAGVGPGGQSGYYTASPEKVASAQERLRHLDEEIANAEQRKKEMKGTAKQSERDRLDEEIKHLQVEREQAQGRLAEAEKGTFHAGRGGGAGGGSGMQFGNPLPSNFGLGKGLPGVAEWLVTFLTDLALAPAEAAIANAMGMTGGEGGGLLGMASGALGGAGLGTPPGPGDLGFGAPGLPDVSGGGGAGVAGPAARGGGTATPSALKPKLTGPMPIPGMDIAAQDIPGGPGAQVNTGQPLLPLNPEEWFTPGAFNDTRFGPGLGTIYGSPPPGAPPKTAQGGSPDRFGTNSIFGQPGNQPPGLPFQRPSMGVFDPGNYPFLAPPIHRATGGPSGTDTIPAWLSPGEFVMNADATSRYLPDLQSMNAQYFDTGSQTAVGPTPSSTTPGPAPGSGAPGGAPPTPAGQGAPGTQGAKVASGPPGMPPGGQQGPGAMPPINIDAHDPGQTPAGLAEAGQAAQQPGATLPQSPGIGFGGGLLGAAEGAASQGGAMALDSMAPGAGQAAGAAMQLLFQEANRAAAYGAQATGILTEGIVEALTPDTGGSDWATTIPGRVLMGVSGVRPSQPNTAGNTQPPLPGGSGQGAGGSSVSGGGQPYGDQIGMQIHGGVTVQANDPNEFYSKMQATYGDPTRANAAYPMSSMGGVR